MSPLDWLEIFGPPAVARCFPGRQQRVAIIGNGPVDAEDRGPVDACTLRVRFNDWSARFPDGHPNLAHGGTHADIVFTNTSSHANRYDQLGFPRMAVFIHNQPRTDVGSQYMSNTMRDWYRGFDSVCVVNPYTESDLRRDTGVGHFTCGFSALWWFRRLFNSRFSFYVCGFDWQVDGDALKDHHDWYKEARWVRDHLRTDPAWTFSARAQAALADSKLDATP